MSPASCWSTPRQLLLLLWKNFLLQVRRPIGTLVEILVPPAACVVIITLKFAIFDVENRCHLTFDSDPLTLPVPNNTYHIYYAPNTSQNAREIADLLRRQESYWSVVGVATEQELVDRLTSLSPPLPPITLSNEYEGLNVSQDVGCFIGGAGVVFDRLEGDGLEYTLRLRHEVGELDTWHTEEASFWLQAPGARVTDNAYLAEGFLHLQHRVAQAIVEWRAQEANMSVPHLQLSVKQIPYPSYRIDTFLRWNSAILPLLLVMAFIYSAGMFTKELVLEKESRIRESMLMMGLQQWVLWTSWFLKQFLFLFISSFAVTLLLKFGQVFPKSNFFILLLFFALFATASIAWGFLISVWFNSARLGMVVAFVAWFFLFIPFFFVPSNYHQFPFSAKLPMCLLTNTCMGLGMFLVSEWEARQQGLTMDTLLEPLTIEGDLHMGLVLVMLFVDTVLFMIVAWYVNGVKPGRYGVPKPFYFPFQPSYWLGRPLRTKEIEVSGSATKRGSGEEDMNEEEPRGRVGISIQNLLKVFDDNNIFSKSCLNRVDREAKRKVAVNELSLNMYEGQITALLGHNGAGKTTTISILTGLYTPTGGTAVINGYDIRSNMDQIRQSLGICPQHNVLFDRLTVSEHLKFFARLKGLGGKAVQKEADRMIEDMQLEDKRNTPSSNLSGGMKRKLSVGIALIGGSKVVVLDEPTSGMDPHARRATWDLLTKHKEGRTILLTTHFMDEADLLGDRIAIMAEGQLRCSGSSLFLKSRYGVGYHMVIVKEPSCDPTKVCELVLRGVRGAQVLTDVGAELSFVLPSAATQHFPALLDTLEADRRRLGVSSYGISVTTMEEVFMKVREGTDETLKHRLERSSTAATLSDLPRTHSPTLPPAFPHSPSSLSTRQHSLAMADVLSSIEGAEERPVRNTRSEENINECEDIAAPTCAEVEQEENVTGQDCVRNYGDWIISARESNKGQSVHAGSKVHSGFTYVPNTGLVLWLQKYWAMLVKRMYASVRFWQAMAAQLLIPLLFVALAMVLAKTILFNDNASDPKRRLGLENAGLSSNLTLFWAEFGDGGPINDTDGNFTRFFDSMDELLTASSLGATDLQDYTGRVLELVSGSVQSGRNTTQCCGYRYQMLDKFCASRSMGELDRTCRHKSSFPYHHCTKCLSCCTSRTTRLPSCTHPLTQNTDFEENEFCPSPPHVSVQDIVSNSNSGPLDSYTAYMDEVLMRLSHDITEPVFTRRVMGGFALQYTRDTPYSVCGSSDTESVCQRDFGILQPCGNDDGRPVYIAPLPQLFHIQNRSCPILDTIEFSYNSSLGNDDCGVVASGASTSSGSGSGDGVSSAGGSGDGDSSAGGSGDGDSSAGESGDGGSSAGGSGEGGSSAGGSGEGGSGDSVCESLALEPGYEVDGLGADFLHMGACDCESCEGLSVCEDDEDRPLAAHYHQDTENTLSATVWYNNRPWHMSAAALNAFHNVWLRQATSNDDLTLTINNHPLPRTDLTNLASAQQANLDGYYIGINVVFGYSFLVASFVLVLVAEKESKAKHLQFVSGGEATSFWLANLTWDMLNSVLPVVASVAIIAVSQVDAYSGIALLAIASLLLLVCWSCVPIVYCASFLFSNSLVAFGAILVVFFLSCLITFLVTLVLPDELINDNLYYVFLLNPAYALGVGMNDIYINHFLRSICTFTPLAQQSCAASNIRYEDNVFSIQRPGIGLLLIYMILEGLVFFSLTLLIERQFFTKEVYKVYRKKKRNKNRAITGDVIEMRSTLPLQQEDSDVVAEAEKVMTGQTDSSDAVIIKNLVKVYPKSLDGFSMRPAKAAVQGISLAIPTGECFGLLGVNGAGKTTTFNILIGDIAPSSGTAIIAGHDIRTDLKKVRQLIGYCPQFDALIERMTGRELLTMFARLRGIPEHLIKQAVEAEVVRLDLTKHASKQCGKYSGGNKRKLSTAIALIGNPPIILLDEPTTGMDPVTRRYLWDVLTGVTREGRSIVLTSHSMEECEALCTRLVIMVNGEFKCLGSIQHLKSKYGSGYTLQAKLRPISPVTLDTEPRPRTLSDSAYSPVTSDFSLDSIDVKISSREAKCSHNQYNTTELHTFITDTFPGATLLEEHQGAVSYQLCSEALQWATVFREMEAHRGKLGVADYAVSQTTLEQVFVNFAREQAEEEQRV